MRRRRRQVSSFLESTVGSLPLHCHLQPSSLSHREHWSRLYPPTSYNTHLLHSTPHTPCRRKAGLQPHPAVHTAQAQASHTTQIIPGRLVPQFLCKPHGHCLMLLVSLHQPNPSQPSFFPRHETAHRPHRCYCAESQKLHPPLTHPPSLPHCGTAHKGQSGGPERILSDGLEGKGTCPQA